jgi:selenocysteine lyase/cysteine desulfurase
MFDRRTFLGALATPIAAAHLPTLTPRLDPSGLGRLEELAGHHAAPEETARDEDFWRIAQAAFTPDRSLINFNNGGVSPAPGRVQEAQRAYLEHANQAPAYVMWRLQEPKKETIRERLAKLFGSDTEEIAITRNASEGLQICQFGFDLEPGDEVLTTNQDYPRMLTTFRQRERREGIVLREISIPVPCEDPAEIVRRFEAAITDRTRLILMCHVINLTGQVLPVKEVVALGRKRGIPVIVDGAHAFAHLVFDRDELDCDFYATSLHKWLFAPFGTGLLYVRRERIEKLWPLMAANETLDDDIRKFEQIGTHPVPNILAIAEALTFHESLGGHRKLARLVYLRDRWAKRLAGHDRLHFNTSLAPGFAGGIANVRIDGVDSGELSRHLWREHKILVTVIVHDEFEGIRVSPSVYSTLEEVDRFADAIEDVLQNGLPA